MWRMPASPRSPRSATGRSGEPLARLLEALTAAGYAVDLQQAVSASGGVNPTRVDLRHGPHVTKLLLYSWFVTLEGHGRGKDDFRIQTTRTHDGPLEHERGRISVGIGWRLEDDVFVAFDAWAKRYTGSSSSVHITRALVDDVRRHGEATGGTRHDPRLGFDAAHAQRFVNWAHSLQTRKEAAIRPVQFERSDDGTARVLAKVHASQPTSWVRERDLLVLVDGARRPDDALWQIRALTPVTETTPGNRPRRFIEFECRQVGTIRDLPQATIEELL
jgi:restriction-modification system family protein